MNNEIPTPSINWLYPNYEDLLRWARYMESLAHDLDTGSTDSIARCLAAFQSTTGSLVTLLQSRIDTEARLRELALQSHRERCEAAQDLVRDRDTGIPRNGPI